MSAAAETLIDRWINDPTFKQQMRQDPEGTVRHNGIQLDEDEWEAIQSIDWSLPDEELAQLVSKMSC